MKQVALLSVAGAFVLAHGAFAQNSTTQPQQAAQPTSQATQSTPPAQPSTATSATTRPRHDANYPNPSGQDSKPNKAPAAPKKATGSAPANGNVESRGSRTSDQSASAQAVAKQKTYRGNTGRKTDPGTACSTARATPNGGVDCGLGGEGATPGKVPK